LACEHTLTARKPEFISHILYLAVKGGTGKYLDAFGAVTTKKREDNIFEHKLRMYKPLLPQRDLLSDTGHLTKEQTGRRYFAAAKEMGVA
jgi:hypothetical protein